MHNSRLSTRAVSILTYAALTLTIGPERAHAGSDTPSSAPSAVGQARATSASDLIVLLLPLVPKRVEPSLASAVDDVLAAQVEREPNLRPVTTADLNALLEAERMKDLLGCDDVSCGLEIGGAVGADRILSGSVAQIGNELVVTLRWLDAVYAEPLAHASASATDETEVVSATDKALRALMQKSGIADATTRKRKKRPTFWTGELSLGVGDHGAPEPYSRPLNATLRLGWGGRMRGGRAFYYLVGGVGMARFDTKAYDRGSLGSVSYTRTQASVFLCGRAAFPLGYRDRLRAYASAGFGLLYESGHAKLKGGQRRETEATTPELRLRVGLWHRFSYRQSLFGGYRMRMSLRGQGADLISEMVEIGSSRQYPRTHELEVGWAYHF